MMNKNIKKKIILLIFLLLIFIPCIICTLKSSCNESKILTIKINQQFAKNYDSIQALKNDSEIIVKGKVIDLKSYSSNSMAITEYKLEVDKSFNSNAKEGDILSIATAGGTINFNEYQKYNKDNLDKLKTHYSEDELKKLKLNFIFDNYDLVELNKEYIIFANTQTVSEENIEKSIYCNLNVNQGQFEVNNNLCSNKYLNYSDSIDNFENSLNKN